MKQWTCENEKCNWTGEKPDTLTVGALKIKMCPNCFKSCIRQEKKEDAM